MLFCTIGIINCVCVTSAESVLRALVVGVIRVTTHTLVALLLSGRSLGNVLHPPPDEGPGHVTDHVDDLVVQNVEDQKREVLLENDRYLLPKDALVLGLREVEEGHDQDLLKEEKDHLHPIRKDQDHGHHEEKDLAVLGKVEIAQDHLNLRGIIIIMSVNSLGLTVVYLYYTRHKSRSKSPGKSSKKRKRSRSPRKSSKSGKKSSHH